MNIIDKLIDGRTKSVTPEKLADILERLTWMLDPKEINVAQILEGWLLLSEDKFRVMVALEIKEYELVKPNQFSHVSNRLIKLWPELERNVNEYHEFLISTFNSNNQYCT